MKLLIICAIFASFRTLAAISIPVPLPQPGRDDFYTPTPGFEETEPGTLLKIRPTPRPVRNLLFFHVPLENSWQLLVRSCDSFGKPNAIVTTVLVPPDADKHKIVSYHPFEESTALKCAPSYNFQVGTPPFGNVVTQDPRGLGVGGQAGHAVLDSLRGVLHSGEITGVSPDAKAVLWGYSGGSIASSWAAAMQPDYAPELSDNIIGAAMGGTVTNLTAALEATDKTILSGIIPLALNGFANEYPWVREELDLEVDPKKKASFQRGVQKCLLPAATHFRGKKILGANNDKKAFFPNGWSMLRGSVFSPLLLRNSLVDYDYSEEAVDEVHVPKVPVFMYHGRLDRIVPAKDTNKLYDKWCANGIDSLEYSESLTSGHVLEACQGANAAWTWIRQRFEGRLPVQGCSRTTRLTNLKYHGSTKSSRDYYDGLAKDKSFAQMSAAFQ
ncbi:Lipase 6 [Candida viswanathii]|uniref:Lipase n=1 Tax=Candida viswanathii TaxID=5486 RepID=A0A367XV31_9ASCO|nr:Lipase 6 [Candida viswanathii]